MAVRHPREAHSAVFYKKPPQDWPAMLFIKLILAWLDIFRMQPPSKVSVKNYSQIFKFSDISKCSLTKPHRNLKIFLFPGKTIISDLFADNARPRSPNQVVSLVKNVFKQSLTTSTCFPGIYRSLTLISKAKSPDNILDFSAHSSSLRSSIRSNNLQIHDKRLIGR
jgi:hypothetical protein